MAAERRDGTEERQVLLLPRDTALSRFGPVADFVAIWRAKSEAGRLPAWSAFDFYDFVGWHGYVYVDEVVAHEPLDMRCRLWGSRLVELLGSDQTGKLFSESPAARDPGRLEVNTRIVREGLISLMTGRAAAWDRHIPFTVVKLPCAEDATTVDHILGCAWPTAAGGR